jgi:hypothetical protein
MTSFTSNPEQSAGLDLKRCAASWKLKANSYHLNFDITLPQVIRAFDAAGLRYALIGGLAMAMRGVLTYGPTQPS